MPYVGEEDSGGSEKVKLLIMKNTEKNKIPKRLLIIGNGFDLA